MADGILYRLNLNWSMHFRVRSRSPVTFKTKLYVATVNNSFQQVAPSYMLHRAWIEYCNMIYKTFKKVVRVPPSQTHTHYQVQPWENMVTRPPRCPKNKIPEVFHIKVSILHLISNELNRVIISVHWHEINLYIK